MYLLALITQVLDLSKIEAGIFEMNKETFDVVKFTNDVITQLKPCASSAGISLPELAIQPPIWITTDKIKLKQVIDNLLSNAIKYNNPHGCIEVSLRVSENKVRLSVTDTGKGIPEHLMSELFKPFCRLGAEAGSIEGTGIGLTITKKLIKMMGGEIGVSSQENQGSTFWIELATVLNPPCPL
jgi:hypothetical protein